jgi:glycosyltransferase involved in cell wall biosynthesis
VSKPTVSIIIAAYQAQGFVTEAVQSALAQEMREVEIIVAPDEPADYGFVASLDPRVRVLPGVPEPTGPGPARNRALVQAQGHFIALLDADDLLSPNYLSALLPLAEARGVAFGRTRITDWAGRVVREVTARDGEVGFADFATAFASFHGVVRRTSGRTWQKELAEDVLFDLESLSLSGGVAPFASEAVYGLRQRPQSVTRGDEFLLGIGPGYERLIKHVTDSATVILPAHRPAVADVWRSWAAMNRRFEAAVAAGDPRDYQAFVAGSSAD